MNKDSATRGRSRRINASSHWIRYAITTVVPFSTKWARRIFRSKSYMPGILDWGYGVGYQGVSGHTETGQGWQGNGYGYGYDQAYSAGYQQGLGDAQAGLTYDCFKHTQYYCNGYSHGFNTPAHHQT